MVIAIEDEFGTPFDDGSGSTGTVDRFRPDSTANPSACLEHGHVISGID
jgi:hypothetical protein